MRGRPLPARARRAGRAAARRSRGDDGRAGVGHRSRRGATGGGATGRGPARRGAGVGAPLVLRRTVSVGRARRVGGRLLGPGAGDVRGARRRVAAGQRHAVDGGLLWTDGAGRRAIHRALLDETGTAGPIETYRFDGKTDPQIVRELLALAGHPGAADEACIAAVCRRYVELLSAELAKPARATRLMVGIVELLAALEPHERASRACVGLLTGNLA